MFPAWKVFRGGHVLTVTAHEGPDMCTKDPGRTGDSAVLKDLRPAVWGRDGERVSCRTPVFPGSQLWASLCFLGAQVALLEPFCLTEHFWQ